MVIFEQQGETPKLLLCDDYSTRKKDSKPPDRKDHQLRFSETIYATRQLAETTLDLKFLYPSTSAEADVKQEDGECCVPIIPSLYETDLKVVKVRLAVF